MKAAVYTGGKTLELRKIPRPDPAPGEGRGGSGQ